MPQTPERRLVTQDTIAERDRRRATDSADRDVMIRVPRSMWRDIQKRASTSHRTASAELRAALDFWITHPIEETIVIDEPL